MNFSTLQIQRCPVELILPLRTRVLRPHFDPGRLARFDGDDLDTTYHYALLHDDQVLGALSFFQRPFPSDLLDTIDLSDPLRTLLQDPNAYQLRGMAIAPDAQNQGLGSHLLATALPRQALTTPRAQLVWCNARIKASSFYQAHHFTPLGDPFHIPDVGLHIRMARKFPAILASSSH